MPTVPVIQDSAQLQTDTGRRRVQADPDAFGAREARGLGVAAAGVEKLGQAAQEIDDEYNRANAIELENQLSQRIRDRLTNTTDGYTSTQLGRAALDTRGQAESDIDGYIAELTPGARNGRALAMFQQLAGQHRQSAFGTIASHASRENTNWQNATSEARLNEFIDNGVAAHFDSAVVAENLAGAIGALQPDGSRMGGEIEEIARRNGWTPEITAQKRRQFQSDFTSRIVVQLAATDPEAAMEMYNRVRPELAAQEAGELLTTVRAAIRQAEDDTIDAGWEFVAAGRPIPADLWARIPGRAQIDIQNERRRRAEGGGGAGDRARYNDLLHLRRNNQTAFLATDLRNERSRLGEAYYGALLEEQDVLRAGGARNGASEDTIRGATRMARNHLRVAGFPLTADGSLSAEADDTDARRMIDFEGDLQGLLDRFVAENNRQPNATEMSGAIQSLLSSHSYDPTPGLWFDRRDRSNFETYTPYAQIPRGVRQEIERRMAADGEPASPGQVERYYETILRQRGGQR